MAQRLRRQRERGCHLYFSAGRPDGVKADSRRGARDRGGVYVRRMVRAFMVFSRQYHRFADHRIFRQAVRHEDRGAVRFSRKNAVHFLFEK